MANAMYMGNSGMFGGSPMPGPMPMAPNNNAGGGTRTSSTPTPPIRPVNEPAAGGLQLPPNEVGPQAVRASGPSQGYDPSYLGNLASFIGSLFSKPAGGGNVTSFDPLGKLNEASQPSGQIGNDPGFGAPLTWLQQALSGGGFSFKPMPPPAVNPPARRTPPDNGGGGIGRGPRQNLL